MYTVSEHKYISVIDYDDPSKPYMTDIVMDFVDIGEITDVKVCSQQGWMFMSNVDTNTVEMYQVVKRPNSTTTGSDGSDPIPPKFIASTPVSVAPDSILPNANCTILAVVHEHQSDILYGEVTLIRDLDFETNDDPEITSPTPTRIPLSSSNDKEWDDDYVLRRGLHMPLTKKSMKYWDELSPKADEIDFSAERADANYKSSLFIEGESIAWAPNQQELVVNLQANNGLLRIDVAKNQPTDLAGYGLKDHKFVSIDINGNDKECNLLTYENLFSMRNPDNVDTFQYNGKSYVMTANEGQIRKYNGFQDSIKVKDLFQNQTFGLPHMDVWPSVFNPDESLGGVNAAPFNSECQGIECVGNLKVSLGSSAIDYEVDPTNPVFERMVLFGGRGWTVYELPENPHGLLKLVYDSGDTIEREICEQIPWAHNTEQDGDYAPASDTMGNNTLWQLSDEDDRADLLEYSDPNELGCADQGDGTPGACPYSQTVDRASETDGPAVERVTSGVACGRLISLVTTEKSGVALLYDMTDITKPTLKQLFHLSEATKDRSPGLAYNDGTIGDVDPEIAMFVSDDDSPSGNAGIFIMGAHSGTISFWEFDCANTDASTSN